MLKTEGEAGGAPSDWSLLERVVRRDEAALSELYDRYSGLVYSEAKRILRDAGAAEEICRTCFIRCGGRPADSNRHEDRWRGGWWWRRGTGQSPSCAGKQGKTKNCTKTERICA